jgi:hypothetical protein
MPAAAYKERPQQRVRERLQPKLRVAPQSRSEQRLKTFHVRVIVTRAEEWWVEAHTPEEAETLLAAGQGHHAALGERLYVELEEILED